MLWRVPVTAGMRLPVALKLPEGVHDVTDPAVTELSDSLVERRLIEAPAGLAGQRIEFPGLQGTIADDLRQPEIAVDARREAHVDAHCTELRRHEPTEGACRLERRFVVLVVQVTERAEGR